MEHSLSELYAVMEEVDDNIARVSYKFIPEEEFAKIDNVKEMQLVYWSEIIQRFHICSATSLLRIKKWYEAIQASYEAENYYGFCSAVRGLLEACSDSFYTMGRVLLPIADNFAHIKIAVEGEAEKALLADELEQDLIHYIFGRKLSRAEKCEFSPSHNAKQVREYLNAINNESLDKLYSELCQISHPSSMSFSPFMTEFEGHGLSLHNEKIDPILNKDLLKRHRETIYTTTVHAIDPSICGLRIINSLASSLLESLKTKEKAFNAVEQSGLWELIKQTIKG